MKHLNSVATLLCMLVLAGPASAAATNDSLRSRAMQSLGTSTLTKPVLTRNKDGAISHLRASHSPIPVSVGTRPEARARLFLTEYRALFVNATTPLEFNLQRVSALPANGARQVRFQQTIGGIPVRGAEAIVHLNATGVTSMHSKFLSDIAVINLAPDVTPARASNLALASVIADHRGAVLEASAPRLEVINVEQLRGGAAGRSRLAWLVEITGGDNEWVWIDAADGRLLLKASRVAHALARAVTDLQGNCNDTPLSQVDYIEGGLTPTADNGADADVIAAWDYAKAAYDYFNNTFARDGFDGAGTNGTIVVNVCGADFPQPAAPSPTIENALFDISSKTLQFSAGMALADDIVAHEYTHAVTYSEIPDGVPVGQFGAIAESFADIFGEVIDQVQAANNDAGQSRWDFGEAVVGSNAFRNLMSPDLHGMPGRVTDSNFYCGADDDIAIHINSGVLSHAFALLVDGGFYNGLTIPGIGIEKAARIFYTALTQQLTSSSSFLDAYNGLLNVANDLVTAGTITANDRSALSKAIAAVELNVTPCSSKIDYCPVGSGAQFLFRDNFETPGSGNWASSALSGVNHWLPDDGGSNIYRPGAGDVGNIYVFENGPVKANSGNFALWADQTITESDPQRLGDSAVAMVSAVAIPVSGEVRMQFEHNFDFDATVDPDEALFTGHPDGSVLEYSIDAGATWADAGSMIASGLPYGGVIGLIGSGRDNPLAGKNAFTGSTGGYVSTQLDLNSLAGQSVLFRFRMGSEATKDRMGWLVDDVAIYSCSTPGIVVLAEPGLQTSESGTTATFTVKLAVAPTAPVTLAVSSSNTGEGTVSPGSVTFTAENWNVEQEIVVTGVADNTNDGDQDFLIEIAVAETSDTAGFATASATTVTVTNVDSGAGRRRGGGGGVFDALLLGLLLIVHKLFCDGVRKTWRRRIVIPV